MKAKQRGFTLIELMITVAIIGILASMASPMYSGYITKSGRTDASAALYNMSALQERYYIQNNEYAATANIAEVGGTTSAEGYYTISITSASTSAFLLTATPTAGQSQANDGECTTLTLSSTGAKGSTGTRANPTDCW